MILIDYGHSLLQTIIYLHQGVDHKCIVLFSIGPKYQFGREKLTDSSGVNLKEYLLGRPTTAPCKIIQYVCTF